MFRRYLLLPLVLLSLQPALATSTLPFVDHLPYATGNLGSVGSAGNWVNSSSAVTVVTNNLDGTTLGLPASSGSMAAMNTGTGSTYNEFASAAGDIASGKVYCSFLLKVTDATSVSTTGERVVSMNIQNGSSTRYVELFFKNVSGAVQLGVAKNGGTDTYITSGAGSSVADGNVYLVVMSHEFVTPGTSNDIVKLWVNPDLGTKEDGNPGVSINTGNDITSGTGLGRLYFTGGVVCNFDELRMGTNWADVAPGSSNPPTPVPVITQTQLLPQGVVLRGTNGPGGGVYQVLGTTNLQLPMTNWPFIAARNFDTNGNFDSTNPVSPGLSAQFFRLLVGGTIPPTPTAPTITNQPQSQTNAAGQTAVFNVLAGGTAPLNYFWFFNTNTLVGGNSNTLTLANVSPNDTGAYFVIVSNNVGTATSSVATLTLLTAPTLTSDPTNLTVLAGSGATFNVSATGSTPLRFQWYFNTNTVLVSATNDSFALGSTHATNAGTYSVIVSNSVGSATSAVAALTVLGPPFITVQPQGQSVVVSNNATFTVTAVGTAPLDYQWLFNTNTPVGANSNLLVRSNVQTNDAGTYSVIITNHYGAVTSTFATLTISTPFTNFSRFNLTGFGQNTTGGGLLAETSPFYAKVTNALSFANAIDNNNIKVIEIMTNLDLGWLEIGAAAQAVGPFRSQGNTPLLHPRLLQTGVSVLDIQGKNGLTIFSANGATIKHCCFNIKSASGIIIRNLKFDEMWEWDESTKGDYDRNDWDFIDLGNGGGSGSTSNIWVDHCTFTKAYDGICDMKGGANRITFSWNKYVGDDGDVNTNSFVWQQINALEANRASYAFYNFLRNNGFSTTNIVTIHHGHDKTHLMGATALNSENALLSATFHHQWYMTPWDRLPRLRAGNVHNYNIFADDSAGLDAKRLRDSIAAAMSPANQSTLNNTYNFQVFLNGSISTENGAILVENSIYQDCITPLRNNQTDVNNPAYTGKIMALNSIYSFRTTGGTTNTYFGSSTNPPGTTYFGPVQAPVIAFSWNTPGGVLPYSYTNTMDDPYLLKGILADPNTGAGAGVLTWGKTNWLKTSY